MKGQKVTFRQQGILIHLWVLRDGTLSGYGMENHLTSKGSGNLRYLLSDISHAHDSPGFTG